MGFQKTAADKFKAAEIVVVTRDAAAASGSRVYFTGKPCKHGHIAQRYVTTGGCLGCLNKWKRVGAKNPFSHDLVPYVTRAPAWRSRRLSMEQLDALDRYVQTAINTFCTHVLPKLCATCDGTHYVPKGDGTNDWKLCPDCPTDVATTESAP